ncbi:ArsR/SmtB family transcription factor [Actinomycetospora lemnae]|uniref:Helix-turn-helix domain-containing protein n=1 Tax=Actinomycetospora lemnae TaxID=3019891 RepID=A0ABT5SNT1_9PSEU|nr:helix-turn-helix domain-containing protein [Actinomycetospora sp. DW7H6]MDD7964500.1 helix-turn-helix domain-containing protein [Actinomycetospora sp. DW7H6]
MLDVDVIDEPAAAAAALDPLRARLLAALAEPGSASTLAGRVGLTRQKVNYHLRTLEAHGLVREVGQRAKRGLTERLVEASAASYLVSPAALGEAGSDPGRVSDRLSARYLLALGGRLVREVGDLARRADATDKRLATLAIDTEIAFASPADRAAFADELGAAVRDLVARHHSPGGRPHRLVVGAHPVPAPTPDPAPDSPEDPS